MSADNPVSPKVVASTAGAGIAAALSSFVIWGVGVAFCGGSPVAADVAATIASVPAPVAGVILLVISALGAGVPGWTVVDPNRLTEEEMKDVKLARAKAAHQK